MSRSLLDAMSPLYTLAMMSIELANWLASTKNSGPSMCMSNVIVIRSPKQNPPLELEPQGMPPLSIASTSYHPIWRSSVMWKVMSTSSVDPMVPDEGEASIQEGSPAISKYSFWNPMF